MHDCHRRVEPHGLDHTHATEHIASQALHNTRHIGCDDRCSKPHQWFRNENTIEIEILVRLRENIQTGQKNPPQGRQSDTKKKSVSGR